MIKTVSTIVMLAAGLFLLTACGKKGTHTSSQGTSTGPATSSSSSGAGTQPAPGPETVLPPAPALDAPPADAVAIAELVKPAREALDQLTDFHEKTWKMSTANAWHPDPEKGTIAWTFDDDRIVIAPLQILGVYDEASKSFTWSWADPETPASLKKDAEAVLNFANQNGLTSFQKPTMVCSEDDVWNIAALATQLGERQGAYKGQEGGKTTFVTFGNVQMSKIKRK